MNRLADVVLLLIDNTIKTSAILLIALGALALLRHRSAALRHWLLAAAIACAWTLPALAAIVPVWSVRDLLPVSSRQSDLATDAVDGVDREADARVATRAEGTRLRSSESIVGWLVLARTPRRALDAEELARLRGSGAMTAFVAIWLTGVVITLLPLVAGCLRLMGIARRARHVARGRWRAIADDASRELGVRRPIVLLRGRHPSMLMTWGLTHPRVLLPASAARWSDQRLRIVLLHELAHVRRGDWSIQMTAELLRCLCWFNPLAWIACRRLRRESEVACDDAVLSRGVERTDYAGHVLDLARTLGRQRTSLSAVAAAMAHPSGLERRIRIMLNTGLDRTPLSHSARMVIAVALAAITLPLAGFGALRQNQGSIAGTVVDQSGAPVPYAQVTLTRGGRDDRTIALDGNGHFDVSGLPASEYRITATAMGFAPLQVQVTLSPDQRIERRLPLSIGTVQETIVLRGANPTAAVTAPLSEAQMRDVITGRGGAAPLAPPSRLRAAMPPYPPQLHDAGVHGTVILEGHIGVDGAISDAVVVQLVHPDLDAVAREAVQQWRYIPTRLHGEPVSTPIKIVFEFEP